MKRPQLSDVDYGFDSMPYFLMGKSDKHCQKELRMKLLAIGLIGFFLCGCSAINDRLGLSDDNFGEEMIEEAIEMKFGVDVDLTPESAE